MWNKVSLKTWSWHYKKMIKNGSVLISFFFFPMFVLMLVFLPWYNWLTYLQNGLAWNLLLLPSFIMDLTYFFTGLQSLWCWREWVWCRYSISYLLGVVNYIIKLPAVVDKCTVIYILHALTVLVLSACFLKKLDSKKEVEFFPLYVRSIVYEISQISGCGFCLWFLFIYLFLSWTPLLIDFRNGRLSWLEKNMTYLGTLSKFWCIFKDIDKVVFIHRHTVRNF